MARQLPDKYRARFLGEPDPLFRKSLVSAALLGALVLAVVFLTPLREHRITKVEEVPERFAKLIIEKPKPEVENPRAEMVTTETPEIAEAEPEPEPKPEVVAPKPRPRPRREEPEPDPDAGTAGRERAEKEITRKLAQTTTKVESALEDLTAALETTTNGEDKPRPKRRRSRVRSGRGSSDIAPVEVAMQTTGEATDAGSAVGVDLVALDGIAALDGSSDGNGAGGGSGNGTGAAPGVYRSTSSLAAVIRRYAAGIQFCYENELKHDATLEGKMIVVISVAASGQVSDVSIARDTVGSDGVRECVLTQIQSWKFPPIAEGATSFQVPFVFTPPKG